MSLLNKLNRIGGEIMLESHIAENVLVDHNGIVFWVPTMIVRTACTIDITYFPWDVQVPNIFVSFCTWSVRSAIIPSL